MRKNLGIGLLVLFLLPGIAFADGHFQSINTQDVSFSVKEKVKLLLETESGFTNKMREYFYQHTEGGVEYAATSWLDLEFAYRHIWEREGAKWETENRPHINAMVKWAWWMFDLSNRSRVEFRVRQNKDDVTRYRNETGIEWSVPGTNKRLALFITDDVFVDFDIGRINGNKLEAGVITKLAERINLEIFFIKESCKAEEKWQDVNGLGTKLKFAF